MADTDTGTAGDGDGEPGDGDGEPGDGDGEPGDGDGEPGDGDGDPGDGDGDPGDGDGDPGDGDGDPGDGDGDPGDGDGDPGDGDGDPGDGDGDPSVCGDGIVDEGEACDDGNADNSDACLDTCVAASCGDGHLWAGVELCDDGNLDNSDDCPGSCEPAVCGDGYTWSGNEACDDGNENGGDGCENDCSWSLGAKKVVTGDRHTCALRWSGEVKCWGENDGGQLGQGNTVDIGDDELPSSIGFVNLGGPAIDIATGGNHNCVIMADASVRCWGRNLWGELGYGGIGSIGNDEEPVDIDPIELGDDAVALSLGWQHSCALTDQATVRCWGRGTGGRLGYGNDEHIGDDEDPAEAGTVDVGEDVVQIAVGHSFSCARLANGEVLCWGENAFGQLGQGNTSRIGDDEHPSSVPTISLGDGDVVDIAAGGLHACALFDNGDVRCWGRGARGVLGLGNTTTIGNNEVPSAVDPIDIGAPADAIGVAEENTCVRIGTNLKCWGQGSEGLNGYGTTELLGDDEVPASYGFIDVGFPVTRFEANGLGNHVCAFSGLEFKCWGQGTYGQLGYGNVEAIGDDEAPASVGLVPYL